MVHPQRTCSHMELLPLVCLCLLSCSGTTSADPAGRVVVEEGSDVILPCIFNGVDIDQELLEWKKNGQTVLKYDAGFDRSNPTLLDDRFSHFKDELKLGNASLKIRNTKVADNGDYTCDTPRLQSSKTVHVELVVDRVLKDRTGENIPGAAPEPYIRTFDAPETSALLQCEAHGVPHLEVHWQDSDGNKLPAEEPQVTERGGLSYITLNMTVTKKGNFYCVATQKNLSHRISAKTYVPLNEAEPQPDNTGLITIFGGVIALLVVAVVVLGVVLYMREQMKQLKDDVTEKLSDGARPFTSDVLGQHVV